MKSKTPTRIMARNEIVSRLFKNFKYAKELQKNSKESHSTLCAARDRIKILRARLALLNEHEKDKVNRIWSVIDQARIRDFLPVERECEPYRSEFYDMAVRKHSAYNRKTGIVVNKQRHCFIELASKGD